MLLVLRGKLEVETGDGVFRCNGRSFLALAPGMPARLSADGHADWVALNVRDEWLRQLEGTDGYRGLTPPLLLPAVLPLDRMSVHLLANLLRRAPRPCESEASREMAELMRALRCAQDRAVDWVDRAYGRSDRHRRNVVARLLSARNRILNAPFASHDLRALAVAARYSPSHFLRSFRDVFGKTPHDMLTEARIAMARELLRDGKLAICEIAASVGYESRHSLSRSFKRATGSTATDYRLACGGG